MFSCSIKENILYGLDPKKVTESDFEEALKNSNSFEFLNNKEDFPLGLETIVGDRGIKLSGG